VTGYTDKFDLGSRAANLAFGLAHWARRTGWWCRAGQVLPHWTGNLLLSGQVV